MSTLMKNDKTIAGLVGRSETYPIQFSANAQTGEPQNCGYSISNGLCIINLAGVTITGDTFPLVATGLPTEGVRANRKVSSTNGIILFMSNGLLYASTGTAESEAIYDQLIYPIA